MSFSEQDIAGMDYVTLCYFCGGGYFRSMGRCHHCSGDGDYRGVGLIYTPTGKPPPHSVVAQIEARRTK